MYAYILTYVRRLSWAYIRTYTHTYSYVRMHADAHGSLCAMHMVCVHAVLACARKHRAGPSSAIGIFWHAIGLFWHALGLFWHATGLFQTEHRYRIYRHRAGPCNRQPCSPNTQTHTDTHRPTQQHSTHTCQRRYEEAGKEQTRMPARHAASVDMMM